MNRNVQKIIEELIKYGKNELHQFEEEWKIGKRNADLLVTAIILLYFQQVSFDRNKENDKKGVDILFMDSAKIFTALNKLPTDIHKKVSFLEWYLERFVHFYVEKSLKEYENTGYLLLEEFCQYLNISEGKRKALLEKSKQIEKKEQSYIFYRELCERMEKLKKNGVLYAQQYDVLFQLGMPTNFIETIRNYQLLQILDRVEFSTKKKNEKHLASSLEDEDKKRNSKIENEQTSSVVSVSRRKLKEELDRYINRSTGENKMIIDGEDLLEVERLFKALYPESKVILEMKRVLANNEKIKQNMYVNVMHELIPNEEDLQLFLKAKTSLNKELKFDPFYSPYFKLVQDLICNIDTYLGDYLLFTEEEKAILKLDYLNQVTTSLSEIKLHLDYLPFWEEIACDNSEGRKV